MCGVLIIFILRRTAFTTLISYIIVRSYKRLESEDILSVWPCLLSSTIANLLPPILDPPMAPFLQSSFFTHMPLLPAASAVQIAITAETLDASIVVADTAPRVDIFICVLWLLWLYGFQG